jgi:hypothetical protein
MKDAKKATCTIYINEGESLSNTFEKIPFTSLDFYYDKLAIIYDPNQKLKSVFKDDQEMINEFIKNTKNNIYLSPIVIRITYNRRRLLDRNVRLVDIATKIYMKFPDAGIVYSDSHKSGEIIMRICLKPSAQSQSSIKNYTQKNLQNLKKVIIQGIEGISASTMGKSTAFIRNKDGSISREEEKVLYTKGSNFKEILQSTNLGVDKKRTLCNNIGEVYECLGLEAAKKIIYDEIYHVLKESGDVSRRHIKLFIDALTYKGVTTRANRHDMKNMEKQPFQKIGFEESKNITSVAGFTGEQDDLKGVSASLIFNKLLKIGPGISEIRWGNNSKGVTF